jgi:hypothetical protein
MILFFKISKSYFTVKKDRNKILSKNEILMLQIAASQPFFIIIYYSILDISFIFYITRFLRALHEIVLVKYILSISVHKEKAERYYKGAILVNLGLLVGGLNTDQGYR